MSKTIAPKGYYEAGDKLFCQEVDVPNIMEKDGIYNMDFESENQLLINIDEIIASKDKTRSWCQRVINTENNSATLIAQLPGEGNRLHYHPNWHEWWYIIDGTWKWEIEGKEYIAKKGDLILMEKGKLHRITAIGDKPAIRLAVSRDLVPHIYPEETSRDS